jgi:hypothetical protein
MLVETFLSKRLQLNTIPRPSGYRGRKITQLYRTYVPIEGLLRRRLHGISGNAGRWCGHVAPSAFISKPIIRSYGNLGFQSCKVGMGQPFWLPKFVMRVKEYQALKKRK